MLWPRMPAGERIAAWVTWNLFCVCSSNALPHQRRGVPLHVLRAVFFQRLHQLDPPRSLDSAMLRPSIDTAGSRSRVVDVMKT